MDPLTQNPIDRTEKSLMRVRYLESLGRFALWAALAHDSGELEAAMTILQRDVPRTLAQLAPELKH